MYFEDLDYRRRVQKAGLGVYYCPDTQVVHYHGASGKNMVSEELQWKRLIPSSRIYHGVVIYHLIGFIIWSSQKIQKVFG
jgi:GT2 family glycosyltransferase